MTVCSSAASCHTRQFIILIKWQQMSKVLSLFFFLQLKAHIISVWWIQFNLSVWFLVFVMSCTAELFSGSTRQESRCQTLHLHYKTITINCACRNYKLLPSDSLHVENLSELTYPVFFFWVKIKKVFKDLQLKHYISKLLRCFSLLGFLWRYKVIRFSQTYVPWRVKKRFETVIISKSCASCLW